MSTNLKLAFVILVTQLLSCQHRSSHNTLQTKGTSNGSLKTSTPVDTPRSFVRSYGVQNNRLFVFVGEKIAVDRLPTRQYSMDNCFKAKYLVLEKVFGNFAEDTIEFVVFDHYGVPVFSKYKNALLFVSADSGTYYHQKYMYNDVYKTKDGRWAGTYAADDYEHDYNKHTKIKPVKIEFAQKVIYPIRMVDDDGSQITFTYPKPYFKVIGDSAIAVYGNYVDDLFKLKRDGYLTAREIFKNGKLQ